MKPVPDVATSDSIAALTEKYHEYSQTILLSGISILWLTPEDSRSENLLRLYRTRAYSFEALREAALQLFLLAGFQASLEAAFQIEAVYGHGLGEGTCDTVRAPDEWHRRGLELQKAVYGDKVDKLRQNLTRISPELSAWTVTIGYGLVLSRKGLPAKVRELLEIAVLAAQGFPRQLHSHLKGALNLGASQAEIEVVLEVAARLIPEGKYTLAMQVWQDVHGSLPK